MQQHVEEVEQPRQDLVPKQLQEQNCLGFWRHLGGCWNRSRICGAVLSCALGWRLGSAVTGSSHSSRVPWNGLAACRDLPPFAPRV